MWKKDNPIQIKPGLHQSLPSFTLNNVYTDFCTSITNTGITTYFIIIKCLFFFLN